LADGEIGDIKEILWEIAAQEKEDRQHVGGTSP
jgi:hypothetical protein